MNSDSAPSEYVQTHAKRFALSLDWVRPQLPPAARVLEIGGASPFAERLRPFVEVIDATEHDLRYPNPKLPDDTWDAVLCMEVLEHVGDQNTKKGKFNTEWIGDGVRAMLSEAFRVLKPGGFLFLTTPNPTSITAIKHALRQAPPQIYRPHVREYPPYEVDELIRAAGFKIERRETIDVWRNAISPAEHYMIDVFIGEHGFDRRLRGEDTFLLATKPILETPKAPIEVGLLGDVDDVSANS